MQYADILDTITRRLVQGNKPCAVVAAPYSSAILSSLQQAVDNGFIGQVLLVGDKAQIPDSGSHFDVEPIVDPQEIASFAAKRAKENAGLLIKGSISSGTLLRAALSGSASSEAGPKPIASHVYVIQSKAFPGQTILVADAGVNIKPDCATKGLIIQNTVDVAHKLGIERPRVAIVCAVESINPHIQSTVDAAQLKAMGERGVFGVADIDGPMAMDAAMIPSAAQAKKLSGPVAGNANVLILDNIEAANSTTKGLIGVDGDAMGVVVGGSIPVAFPSRGDTEETRYHSLLLAAYLASFRE
ncbi:MAG: phosphate acyltransferase [Spongiibacteraceae bacterium]